MTLQELEGILSTTGIPVAYNVFKEPQNPPYICYIDTQSDNIGADNEVWAVVQDVQIELYTKIKSPSLESKVETALQNAVVFFQSDEEFLDDEKVYVKTYTIQIIGG